MDRVRRVAAGSALGALLLAGCGGHAVHSVLDGVPAPDVARTAALHLQSEPYRFSMTVAESSDTSSVVAPDPQIVDGLERGLKLVDGLAMQGDLENTRRISMRMTIRGVTLTLVAYDGNAFGSANGHDYAALPSLDSLLGSGAATSTPTDISTYLLPSTTTVQGRVDHNGTDTEHISGDIDPAAFARLIPQQTQAAGAGAALIDPQAAAGAQAAVRAFTLDGGHIDEYVGLADGQPVALDMTYRLSLDLASFLSALSASLGPGAAAELSGVHGKLKLSFTAHQELSDRGAAVHVERPTPDLTQQEFVAQYTAALRGS